MGQKEKARQIADDHGFSVATRYTPSEIQSVVEAAAAASATGGLKGQMVQSSKRVDEQGLLSAWVLKGPGGFSAILDLTVQAVPVADNPGTFSVTMKIGSFKYMKGSFFTAPTLGGSKVIRQFGSIVCSELTQ